MAQRDERRAREIVFGYADKDFSLTDATSFAVMERLRIPQAFTLDRNFAQFGWAGSGIATPDANTVWTPSAPGLRPGRRR